MKGTAPSGRRGVQEILDSTRSLVDDWSAVHTVCPASFPPERVNALRQRSKCFASTLEGNCGNFFWLTVCQMSLSLVPTTSCVFQPVAYAVPLTAFAHVCVVISGYGDGVRRGILHAIQLLGGECAPLRPRLFLFALTCVVHVPHATAYTTLRR